MRRFVILALALFIAISFAAIAMAYQVTHDANQIGFDGTIWHHQHGVRLGDLETKFDDAQGLTYVHYRITPMRGKVRFLDLTVTVNGQVAYQHSKKKTLNIDLHFFETPAKHYEEAIRFDQPVKGFGYENGEIKWYFQAGDEKYVVTWRMKDNEMTTAVVKDEVETPAAAEKKEGA